MIDSAATRSVARARLAQALDVPLDRLTMLTEVPAADVEELLHLVHDHFFAATEEGLGKVVAASKLLPPPIAAKVAAHNDSALMTAHLASVMEPDRALAVATRLRPEFLALVAARLDLRRSSGLISGLPVDLAGAIVRELADAGDWLTLGAVVEVATADQLDRCLHVLDVEEIIATAHAVTDTDALARLAAAAAAPLAQQLRDLPAGPPVNPPPVPAPSGSAPTP